MYRQQGLSLLELLITMVIIGVIAATAAPALTSLVHSTNLKQAHADLRQSIILARSEAVRRGQRVAVHSTDGLWELGWRVFVDENENGTQDGDELTIQKAIPGGTAYTIRNTGSGVVSLITYNRDGRSIQPNGAFLARTFVICDGLDATPGFKLVIAAGGRVRSEKLSLGADECD